MEAAGFFFSDRSSPFFFCGLDAFIYLSLFVSSIFFFVMEFVKCWYCDENVDTKEYSLKSILCFWRRIIVYFFLDVVKSVGFKWRIFTYFLLIFGYDEFGRNVEIKFVKKLFDR